ncbi:hypothetical protein HYU13_04360 [Candidatus Woesearchaeota archaeon]|nr:hypothetical protein [Candidatus Woesearchaeota archaeon]
MVDSEIINLVENENKKSGPSDRRERAYRRSIDKRWSDFFDSENPSNIGEARAGDLPPAGCPSRAKFLRGILTVEPFVAGIFKWCINHEIICCTRKNVFV